MARGKLKEQILEAAVRRLAESSVNGLTFDSLAAELGVSKQAVLYWFPSKEALIRSIALPGVEAEAAATVAALAGAAGAQQAIARFLEALVGHHLADLPRFRAMYLAAQMLPRPDRMLPREAVLEHIYPVTGRMYGALEAVLAADPAFRGHPRQTAVAVHAAGLGLVLMLALAEAVDDPLAHATEALVAALVARMTAGL